MLQRLIADDGSKYGVLTTGGAYQITGSAIDFETFKLSFHNTIGSYSGLLGTYTIDLLLTDNEDGTATVQARITFSNMIDACYFVGIYPDSTGTPDFCAVYLPTALSDSLHF